MRALDALIAAGALGLLLGGCTPLEAPSTPRTASVVLTPAQAYDVWDSVLQHRVDARGRVNFAALAHDRAALDRFVSWIYRFSPANRPRWFASRQAVLAYHINAYNALAMYSVLAYGDPETLGPIDRLRFFVWRKIRVGGRTLSLYAYENKVIRPLGDPRVHFALNCMAVSCPRLPRHAFRPARLDAELNRAARDFFNSRRSVVVDRADESVRLSAILKWYRQDFLAEAPSLIAYANRYRDTPIPPSYRIMFMGYDWTINRQRRD